MRPITFQITEQENRHIEFLMDSFGIDKMAKVFMEGIRVLGLMADSASDGFTIPCSLRTYDGSIKLLGPGLDYLINVVERSEDNMVITFVPKAKQS